MLYDRHFIHDPQQLSLRASSGYPNYAAYLTSPINVAKTLSEFRDMNFLEDIANTEYGGDIVKPGQVLRFRHRVRGALHRYQLNQRLKTDVLDFRFVEICMNRALYANLKLEILDHSIAEIKKAIEEWRSSLAEESRDQMLYEALAHIIFEVPGYAQGNAAGYRETTKINLGSDAQPLTPVAYNVLEVFKLMALYKKTAGWPSDGNWAVIDYDMWAIIFNSPTFNESCCLGDLDKNSMVSGRLPVTTLSGFNIYVTDKLPLTANGNRFIPFGNKMALTYGSDVIINRTVEPTEDFSKRHQWLWLYGFGVIYRHMLGLVIWSTSGLSNGGIHDLTPPPAS